MADPKTPKDDEVLYDEIRDELEKHARFALDYLKTRNGATSSVIIHPVSTDTYIFWAVSLVSRSTERQEGVLSEMSACIQQQEALNKEILKESKTVRWLTWGVFILTAAVVGLTIALLVKG